MASPFPLRIGSTSYVFPAEILPNVRQLAPLVDDVELVLFEIDELNNLPSPDIVAELNELASAYNLSYTVHLPLDLRLAANEGRKHSSLEKARHVIQSTRDLKPWAYVVHLDGTELLATSNPGTLACWREEALPSLEMLGQEAGDLQRLAIENLENYDPAAFLPLLDRLPVSLCVDVGHFLRQKVNPMPYLRTHLSRTKVIHLHGIGDEGAHGGLELLPDGLLRQILDLLVTASYQGVLTLEVFTETQFFGGWKLIKEALGAKESSWAGS